MKDIVGLVEPRQVVLVTTSAELDIMGKRTHKDNIITVDWHMPCSFKPFLYAISIGTSEYTHELIMKSHVFCVNFMSTKFEDALKVCGKTSGHTVDKFVHAKLTKEQCDTIDAVRIKEALGYVECEVVHTYDCGDHTIFVGKVSLRNLKKNERRVFHLDKGNFTTTHEF